MLSLYKLEIFMLAAEQGSFSKAAERLYLSQSAVSQHIQELESTLGTSLFERGRRGVTLTEAGHTLFDYTQKILKLIAEAENAVTNVHNLADGQVNIGATPGINIYLLPGWIQLFQQQHPNLTASLQTDTTQNIIKLIHQGKLDIGIVEGEIAEDMEHLGVCALQEIDLFVIIGRWHQCWYRKTAPPDALDGQAFVVRQQGSQTRTWFESILAQHHIKPRVIAEFDNPESLKHAVASGMGITILPEYVVQREVEMGLLKAIPIENVPLRRTLKLIWDERHPFSPITRAFLLTLAQKFPQTRKAVNL